MEPGALGGAEARESAQRLKEETDGSAFRLLLTPPLPDAWPPSQGSGVVYWAYVSEALPTGEASYEVHSPELGIRFIPTVQGKDRARIERLASRLLATETREPNQPQDVLDRAAESLFRIVTGGSTSEDPQQLRAVYGTWVRDHPVIAAELAARSTPFFDWLKAV
jgi:hypothetical protein